MVMSFEERDNLHLNWPLMGTILRWLGITFFTIQKPTFVTSVRKAVQNLNQYKLNICCCLKLEAENKAVGWNQLCACSVEGGVKEYGFYSIGREGATEVCEHEWILVKSNEAGSCVNGGYVGGKPIRREFP